MTYSSTITGTTGLTNYWRFEGNGTATTGAVNMTIATGYSTSSAGWQNNGLTADSSATKTGCTLAIANTFFNTAYSIEFWFKAGQHRSSQQELMRMSNDLALEIDTAGKLYYYYNGSSIISPSAVDDNNWHHVVITRNSSRLVTMYLDGASVGTPFTANTSAPTSGTLYFGGSQYTTQAVITGQLDELALYNTNLSSGTVSAHYAAGFTDGGYTAQAMHAFADADGSVGAPNSTTRSTFALTSFTGTGSGGSGSTAYASLVNAGDDLDYTVSLSGIPSNAVIHQARLMFKMPAGMAHSTNGYSTLVPAVGGSTLMSGLSLTGKNVGGVGLIDEVAYFNVKTSVQNRVTAGASSFTGQASITSSANSVYMYDDSNTDPTKVPYLEVVWSIVPVSVTVNATALTASGTSVDPVVTTTSTVNYSATPMLATADINEPSVGQGTTVNPFPMTATALMVDPSVSTIKSPEVLADPMTAGATMPGGVIRFDGGFTATAMSASAAMVSPTLSFSSNVTIHPDALAASARLVNPTAVNGNVIGENQDEDDYYNRVRVLNPRVWWRMTDLGDTITDPRGGTANNGTAVNTLAGRNGPQSRASRYFNGNAYIAQNTPGEILTVPIGSESSLVNTSIEFSIRTTKADQFIMQSDYDIYRFANTGTDSNPPPYGIYLTGGKVRLSNWKYSTNTAKNFDGIRVVNDGEWHHIIIKRVPGQFGQGFGVEIWIDGQFDRRTWQVSNFIGFPDYVGGLPGMAASQAFVGDISEIAFYDAALSDTDIPRNYYAFMGWKPVATTPATATATMPNARAKGNQKRALALYWNKERRDTLLSGPLSGGTGNNPKPDETVMDAYGFKMFVKNLDPKKGDAIYDFPDLFDFDRDTDLEDYDAVVIVDWPETSADFDYINANFIHGAYDRLVEQLQDVAVAGKSLFVPSARLAIDLGIVDRVDEVNVSYEQAFITNQGNATGLYDYGSAVKFPWNIASNSGLVGASAPHGAEGTGDPMNTDPTYLAGKAFYYMDSNYINKFRVRRVIEGLTDIPSYMIADSVWHVDYASFGQQGLAEKYLHRENGLLIGDEFEYQGADGPNRWLKGFKSPSKLKVLAVPDGHVLAGKVVTTFASTYWQGKSEVDSPYADYATTIVLEPGDELDGVAVTGKVFVSFTEAANTFLHGKSAKVMVLPDDDNDVEWPSGYKPETAAQREWDYSFTRTWEYATNVQNNTTIYVTDTAGNIVPVQSGGDSLPYARLFDLFPSTQYPIFAMTTRGLFWLGTTEEVNAGDVKINALPMTATATAVQPSVTAQKPAQVNAQAATANAYMPKVAEDQSGDAQALALPMTASAEMTGYSRTIYAEPMTATATIVENFNMVHAGGEHIVLTLHTQDAILYLKEDA